MHRARKTPERVRPKVATTEVAQLVKQHETPLLMCPVTSFIRQQHRALQKTRRARHKAGACHPQTNATTQTKRALALSEKLLPDATGQWLRIFQKPAHCD